MANYCHIITGLSVVFYALACEKIGRGVASFVASGGDALDLLAKEMKGWQGIKGIRGLDSLFTIMPHNLTLPPSGNRTKDVLSIQAQRLHPCTHHTHHALIPARPPRRAALLPDPHRFLAVNSSQTNSLPISQNSQPCANPSFSKQTLSQPHPRGRSKRLPFHYDSVVIVAVSPGLD